MGRSIRRHRGRAQNGLGPVHAEEIRAAGHRIERRRRMNTAVSVDASAYVSANALAADNAVDNADGTAVVRANVCADANAVAFANANASACDIANAHADAAVHRQRFQTEKDPRLWTPPRRPFPFMPFRNSRSRRFASVMSTQAAG